MAFNNRNNLNNESAPWGREVEGKIGGLERGLTTLRYITENNNKALSGSMRSVEKAIGLAVPSAQASDRVLGESFALEIDWLGLTGPEIGTLANNFQGKIASFSLAPYLDAADYYDTLGRHMVAFARVHVRALVDAIFTYPTNGYDPVQSSVGISVGVADTQTTSQPDQFFSAGILSSPVVYSRVSGSTTQYRSHAVPVTGSVVLKPSNRGGKIQVSFRPIADYPINFTNGTVVFDNGSEGLNYTSVRAFVEIFWLPSGNTNIF